MSRLDRYLRIKKQVEDFERQLNKDQGALEQAIKQLKGIGFIDLLAAMRGLSEASNAAKAAAQEFQKALKKFEKKWKGKL